MTCKRCDELRYLLDVERGYSTAMAATVSELRNRLDRWTHHAHNRDLDEFLSRPPHAHVAAMERRLKAEGMRMAADIKRGIIGTAAAAGHWAAYKSEILKRAAALESEEIK